MSVSAGGKGGGATDGPVSPPTPGDETCGKTTFGVNLTGVEAIGLACTNASSAEACVSACCRLVLPYSPRPLFAGPPSCRIHIMAVSLTLQPPPHPPTHTSPSPSRARNLSAARQVAPRGIGTPITVAGTSNVVIVFGPNFSCPVPPTRHPRGVLYVVPMLIGC